MMQTGSITRARHTIITGLLIAASTLLLSACGESTTPQANPPALANSNAPLYTGPAPQSADIQAYKLNFWDNLSADNRCGGCHDGTDASPAFVHRGNVNVAYLETLDIVDFDNYANSLVVTKIVDDDHNCWLSDNQACSDIVEGYIQRWRGEPAAGGRQINLVAPAIKDPGESKNFPPTAQSNAPNSFALTVYPILTANCSECHAENSDTPISPFFASEDVNSAYDAAKSKMNLDSPIDSRFVVRLSEEFHNCWTTSCDNDALDMQNAIAQFAGAIVPTEVDPTLITSKAVTLDDATIATGGSRYETNIIALWEFKSGPGNSVAFDTSGVEPALDLTLSGSVDWDLANGIDIIDGKAQGSTANSKKLYDLITATGEYSVEAWLVPGNVTQDDSSIITYAAGGGPRNFTIEQDLYNYTFKNRTESLSTSNGNPPLSTADADEDLQASLQHVVMNFDPVNGRQIFVNGVFTDDIDPSAERTLASWSPNYAFALGNEPSGGALWKGKIRMVGIHNRALSQEQIDQNFEAGVGKKFFMLFSVAERIGIPDSYILFHVEQFDNYAYLFNEPRFINLDEDWVPTSDIVIKGLRIAVNGREAVAAQAFANMDEVVNSTDYDYSNNGQTLSPQGTIIPLEKGPGSDEFFLTFEELTGTPPNPFTEPAPVVPGVPTDADPVSDIGLRTFEEINATMSAVTGIPTTNATVSATFDTYRQQLPVVEDINTFLSSHQMAIAQLAMSYCDVLVTNNPGYFAGFSWGTPAGTAFDTDVKKNQVFDPLLRAIMNVDTNDATNNLQTQPGETDIRNALGSTTAQELDPLYGNFDTLVDCMTRCAAGGAGAPKCPIYFDYDINGIPVPSSTTCTATEATNQNTTIRTEEVVKATCAATLGSASMLVQ